MQIDVVIADGPYDSAADRNACRDTLDSSLVTPVCSRRRSKKKVDARGIDHVDAYGRPVCIAEHQMELLGRDTQREQYIWACCPAFHPLRSDEKVTCELWETCCRRAANGRVYRRLPADRLGAPSSLKNPQKALCHAHAGREDHLAREEGAVLREVLRQGFADRYVTVFNIITFVAWAT